MNHQQILAMLAGASSQKPMAFDDLVKASGLLPATLDMVLVQMAHAVPATINCASITRAGKTQMVYWPTGVIDKGLQPFRINQARPALSALRPQASPPQPSTSIPSKEIPMSIAPSKLNTVIYDKIAEEPGIAQDDLIAFALPKVARATEKQVRKTIQNLVHSSGKIRSEGPRGKFTYYLTKEVKQPAATLVKKSTDEKITAKRSDPAVSVPTSSTVKKQEVIPGKANFLKRIKTWLMPAASSVVKKQKAKPAVREALYIHEQIQKAVLPLLEKYDLELIDLIGELNHAAWELSVLNKAGIKKLIAELEEAKA